MAQEFSIRFADINDMKNVFDLSNDDAVRKYSFNKEKIKWEDHVKWFTNRISKTNEPFYIAETFDKKFIAQIRFNKEQDEFTISVSIDKAFRGKGLGSKIIEEASKKAAIYPIVAYIKNDNIPSQKSFIKAGYKPDKEKIINNEAYLKYTFML